MMPINIKRKGTAKHVAFVAPTFLMSVAGINKVPNTMLPLAGHYHSQCIVVLPYTLGLSLQAMIKAKSQTQI